HHRHANHDVPEMTRGAKGHQYDQSNKLATKVTVEFHRSDSPSRLAAKVANLIKSCDNSPAMFWIPCRVTITAIRGTHHRGFDVDRRQGIPRMSDGIRKRQL